MPLVKLVTLTAVDKQDNSHQFPCQGCSDKDINYSSDPNDRGKVVHKDALCPMCVETISYNLRECLTAFEGPGGNDLRNKALTLLNAHNKLAIPLDDGGKATPHQTTVLTWSPLLLTNPSTCRLVSNDTTEYSNHSHT